MPRAVLKDGVIYPLEPLPPEWTNGTELWVEESPFTEEGLEETDQQFQATEESLEEIDRQFQALEAAAQEIDPKDIEAVEAALREADQRAKEWMRREMKPP